MQDNWRSNHGYEAMLDFQMSWLMRLAAEKNVKKKKLHQISKEVLLRLIESVYFVDEEYRSPPAEFVTRPFAYLADVGDAGKDAGEPHEIALCRLGDDFGKRRLAAPGRPIEDYVGETVGLYHAAKELAFAKYVILPDDFLKRRGPHARGKRLGLAPFHASFAEHVPVHDCLGEQLADGIDVGKLHRLWRIDEACVGHLVLCDRLE